MHSDYSLLFVEQHCKWQLSEVTIQQYLFRITPVKRKTLCELIIINYWWLMFLFLYADSIRSWWWDQPQRRFKNFYQDTTKLLPYTRYKILTNSQSVTAATGLAQSWENAGLLCGESMGSRGWSPDRTNTQDLKITEENVLPL